MRTAIPEIKLNDGLTIPAIGFGTYSLKGNEGANAIKSAIDIGYRLIDTAYNYENEGAVGDISNYLTLALPARGSFHS